MRRLKLGQDWSVDDLLALARGEDVKLEFGRAAQARVAKARAAIERILAGGRAVYGVNTGFGALAKERIAPADCGVLQRNLLLSHAVGCGADLPAPIVRAALALRIHSMCRGVSGVRPDLVRWLIALHSSGWTPRVPEQGSVGACGDLAPLAHLALPVIGAGEMRGPDGQMLPAAKALPKIGLAPLALEAKEGLALINGMQISNAIGLAAWARLRTCSVTADLAAALSLEALLGSHRPFDARVVGVRPHPGAVRTAANLRKMLKGSQVAKSHHDCARVQDPYSFRCVPQVHGAAKDALTHLGAALACEADAVSDNPLVFVDGADDVVSAGNFHGQPIALPLDYAANAVAAWGNISERRVSTLIHPAMNAGLPAFLTSKPGLNSGFMIPQVVAAALASENKFLASPASAATITTSADQEDHVSMANFAARKLTTATGNLERILAIELLAAAQAREFHRDLRAGVGAEAAYRLIRQHAPPLADDRWLAPELGRIHALVEDGAFVRAAERACGALES
jgi:histidine ammonia-lyase